jgi:hypothetical protein
MIWFLDDVGLSSTVVFLHLQYGATRVECQPDGTLAYPGAHIQGENGTVFFFTAHLCRGHVLKIKSFSAKVILLQLLYIVAKLYICNSCSVFLQ